MIKFAEKRGLGIYIAGGEPPLPPTTLRVLSLAGVRVTSSVQCQPGLGGGGLGTPV